MLKRILYFDHTAKLGGGEIALLHLLRRLDREHYFPVVALASDGPLREKLEEIDIETHIVPLAPEVVEIRKDTLGGKNLLRMKGGWLALKYCFTLAGFIRRARIDLVHTNSLKADLLGGLAARLARVPVLWHIRDRIDTDYLPKATVTIFRELCQWLPTFVIANSQATLDTLQLPAKYSSVAYSGLVVHDGIPEGVEPSVEKPDGPPVVVLVGRLTEWKGQHIFIAAAARVHTQFPDVRFRIIGSAMFGEESYEKRIREMVADLGLEKCVEFTGFRTDVMHLIQLSEILVHASITGEPFGQVVIEGMAAGKPVVATDGGGIPEIVRDGVTGILVPMGDAKAMADALMKLLSDPDLGAAMGIAGRQRVLDYFTARQTARRVEEIYRRIFPTDSPRFPPGG